MSPIFEVVRQNPLFAGMDREDVQHILECLQAKILSYSQGQVIWMAGCRISSVGILLKGQVRIGKQDLQGNLSILEILKAPELIGGVFACMGIKESPVTVEATSDCEILMLDYRKMITSCEHACRFHSLLIENMMVLLAQKNLLLNEKIEVLSKRSTKEKLLYFLQLQSKGEKEFTIPFNREEMAAYLCVDRSALSKELCHMRDQGILWFSKNRFRLH